MPSPVLRVFALLTAFLSLAGPSPLHAQTSADGLEGVWHGTLEAGGAKLTAVFHLERGDDSTLTATMDVPQQGASGIPVSGVRATEDSLRLVVGAIGGVFEGARTGAGPIEGTWRQNGAAFPLVLQKGEPEANAAKTHSQQTHPQTPEPPFPYHSEDVRFAGGDDVTLAGTLTLPRSEAGGDGPHPAVVLISGSGPQNRNGLVAGHETLHVLADYLTRRGVAVLRYDERGVGESTGAFAGATTEDFAADVRGGLDLLQKRDDIGKIGLIGWSEGGLIAPMIAVRSAGAPNFLVLMGAPGVPGDEIIAEQVEQLALAKGATPEQAAEKRALQERILAALTQAPDSAAAAERVQAVLQKEAGRSAERARAEAEGLTQPWYRNFLSYEPRPALRETNVPVLALYGTKDVQVPPEQNAPALREGLADNADATVRVLPGLNHLFQPAETGLPGEYRRIETTIAPKALDMIGDWMAKRTRAGGSSE